MTQSKDDTITIDLSDYTTDPYSSVITSSNLDSITTISGISTSTVNINDITTSLDDQISFDFDNIKIVPTLWTETLPDVDTVNAMCNEYPALAKAYENFQTVYKLVDQDYKGKQDD
jgi:N-acyl-D-aspartate/D-glutamate deacylase|tara:strand:- start:418 stop:765 length:348 start_codon:yes stop_codon:yes gene_type:complete